MIGEFPQSVDVAIGPVPPDVAWEEAHDERPVAPECTAPANTTDTPCASGEAATCRSGARISNPSSRLGSTCSDPTSSRSIDDPAFLTITEVSTGRK